MKKYLVKYLVTISITAVAIVGILFITKQKQKKVYETEVEEMEELQLKRNESAVSCYRDHLYMSCRYKVRLDGIDVEYMDCYRPTLVRDVEYFNAYNPRGMYITEDELLEEFEYFCEHGACIDGSNNNVEGLETFCDFFGQEVNQKAGVSFPVRFWYSKYCAAVHGELEEDDDSEESWREAAIKILTERVPSYD